MLFGNPQTAGGHIPIHRLNSGRHIRIGKDGLRLRNVSSPTQSRFPRDRSGSERRSGSQNSETCATGEAIDGFRFNSRAKNRALGHFYDRQGASRREILR